MQAKAACPVQGRLLRVQEPLWFRLEPNIQLPLLLFANFIDAGFAEQIQI